ncbi:hypothetical protein AB0D10_05200 [Kitasatospora sp. NPDC048545]
MTDYLIFLARPHPADRALRAAHLAAVSLLAAFIASAYYRRTT